MKPTQPIFLFKATPLPTPTYASVTHLLPHLASFAPLQIESWSTAIRPVGAPAIVHLFLYHRGALPPPPSYVPSTPTPGPAGYPGVDAQVPSELPEEAGLIAQFTFVEHNGSPMLVSGSPVLGSGASQLASPPPPVFHGTHRAEAVALVGEWIASMALANGQSVPWAYGGASRACVYGHGQSARTAPTETSALLGAALDENRRLMLERRALCLLCLLCCCSD